jgi:hypothetical protein
MDLEELMTLHKGNFLQAKFDVDFSALCTVTNHETNILETTSRGIRNTVVATCFLQDFVTIQ